MAPQCPECQQTDVRKLEGQRAVCRSCSKAKRCVFLFCWTCQRKWPQDSTAQSCTLPNCALRSALLSEARITDPSSSVMGCPFFRACMKCKALLTHSGEGCPNIQCPQCAGPEFCFRCMQSECYEDDGYDDYEYDYDVDDYGGEVEAIGPCVIVENRSILSDLKL